jgi:hypothetical protein
VSKRRQPLAGVLAETKEMDDRKRAQAVSPYKLSPVMGEHNKNIRSRNGARQGGKVTLVVTFSGGLA